MNSFFRDFGIYIIGLGVIILLVYLINANKFDGGVRAQCKEFLKGKALLECIREADAKGLK